MLLCQPWKNTSDPSGKRSLSERAVYARSCIGASVRTSREEKELKGSLPENLVDQGQCMRPNHSLHKSSATLSRLEIYFQMRTCPPCTSSRLHSIPPGAPLSAGKFFHVKDLQFPNCERLVLPLITGQLRLKDAIAGSKRALTLFKLSKLPSPSLQKCDERDGNRRDLSSH